LIDKHLNKYNLITTLAMSKHGRIRSKDIHRVLKGRVCKTLSTKNWRRLRCTILNQIWSICLLDKLLVKMGQFTFGQSYKPSCYQSNLSYKLYQS